MKPFTIAAALCATVLLTAGGTLYFLGQTAGASDKAADRYHLLVQCPGAILYESISQEKPTLPSEPLATVRLNRHSSEYLLSNNCRAILDDPAVIAGATSDLSVYLPKQPEPKVATKTKAK